MGGQVDPREVRSRLDAPRSRLLLDRGYTIDLVREAIEEKLRQTGS